MKISITFTGVDHNKLKTYTQEIELGNHHDKAIIDLAKNQGIFLKSSCGGKGKCGRCMINLIEGRFLIRDKEIVVSKPNTRKALSCITRVLSDNAVIEIPQDSLIETSGKIIDDFVLKYYEKNPTTKKYCLHIPQATLESQTEDCKRMKEQLLKRVSIRDIHIPLPILRKLPDALLQGDQTVTVTLGCVHDFWSLIDVEPADTTSAHYGMAADIGTTTVVVMLIDLTRGEIIGKSSLYNRQMTVAEDVISRISSIQSQKEIDLLKYLVIDDTLNPIIRHLCNEYSVKRRDIRRVALSGNTIMMHMLLGINPQGIGKVPFHPVTRVPDAFSASEVGLDIAPNGIVDLIPSVSGYIGGDIISDIYVSKLHEDRELSVLIDIGTNGEIVMCDDGNMVACSTAAGPAFEGYGLYHGCRASKGAIERVSFDKNNNVVIEVIGGGKANGICGTGMIDFIAEGLRIGLIDRKGKLNNELLKKLKLDYKIQENGKNIKACIIAGIDFSEINEPIVISELDISKILLAKAAVYAGMKILLKLHNKTWQDIKRFVLTGGFARQINLHNAVSIGLLPSIPEDRIEVIGNGSLAGAFLALVEPNAIDVMTAISSKIDVIELNMYEDFQKCFVNALFLHNSDKVML